MTDETLAIKASKSIKGIMSILSTEFPLSEASGISKVDLDNLIFRKHILGMCAAIHFGSDKNDYQEYLIDFEECITSAYNYLDGDTLLKTIKKGKDNENN